MSCATLVCAASYSMAALLVAKLTPAEVTPAAPASASCTVAAQLAQVMPSMGKTIRALPMLAVVELVRRRCRAPLAFGFNHEQPLQHVHAAAEGVLARLVGGELDRGRLKRRKLLVDPKALEDDALRAIGRLVSTELQAHGFAGLYHDRIGGVATLHHDANFLDPARARRCRGGPAARIEEIPQHPDDGDGAQRRNDDLGAGHEILVSGE